MLNIIKLSPLLLLFLIIRRVKNNTIGCKLYSQCEARARYEEQLCVGHEWRKPNFLTPTYPVTMTNKSKCYATLKPEFDMIERLETEMYDEYYGCLIGGVKNVTTTNEECDKENYVNIKFDGTVDPPISCFNGRIRIERECGFLKPCCSRIQKCSMERRKSNNINKLLELHKQVKSQLHICKNGSKSKRRHPNKDGKKMYDEKVSEGRLNIRIGNTLNDYDKIELLSNLKEAPKEGVIFSGNLKGEKKEKKVFVGERKVEEDISSVRSENSYKSSKIINNKNIESSSEVNIGDTSKSNKEISSSKVDSSNTNSKKVNKKNEDEDDDDNDNIEKKVKKILCQRGKSNSNEVEGTKDINNFILNEWFTNKINNENKNKIIEESSNNMSQNSNLKLLKENEKMTLERLREKNDMSEKSLTNEESYKKNESTEYEEKGEVSDPFILLTNKFQKIYFPKLKLSTEYPPHLEMVTKGTHLTFENVTSKKVLITDNDNEDKSYERYRESVANKETGEGRYNKEIINQKMVNHKTSKNFYSSKNSSKEEMYEDRHEKMEYSNFMGNDNNKKIKSNEKRLEDENKVNDKVVNQVGGIDIMKKEYQDHLQKILELKKKEEEEMRERKENTSFFKLNSAKKSSFEERNEELIEMTEVNNGENMIRKNNSISIDEEDEGELKQLSNIVSNCKLRYAGAVKILDDDTKPISLKNSFINWKKTLDEKLIKVREDKTISSEKFNEFFNKIQRDTNEIAKIINSNDNEEDHNDTIFGDVICQPLVNEEEKEEEDIVHTINDSNYKKSIELFKKTHSMASNLKIPNETKFLTSCDYYVKCRSHINLLLDKCSSLITERPAIPSTESILLSGLNMCGDINVPFLGELYSLYTKRNMKLRSCLKKHDDVGGSTEVCTNKINNLILTTKEIIKYQEEQFELGKCFSDVNNLQNKCYQMSKCCPEYEECKKNINDIKVERRIIYLTSKITENNQNCLEKYERKFFNFDK